MQFFLRPRIFQMLRYRQSMAWMGAWGVILDQVQEEITPLADDLLQSVVFFFEVEYQPR